MTRRSIRHPFGGGHWFMRDVRSQTRAPRPPRRRPRIHRRRSVNVGALMASPHEVPSRPNLRLAVVGLLFIALFAVMVLRLWSLQVIGQKTANAAVNENQVRVVSVPAPRGQILDRTDRVLVGNEVEEEIALSQHEAQVNPAIVAKVAALVGETPKTVRTALKDSQYSPYQPVPILVGAPLATVQYLLAHPSEFPGVSVEASTVRDYPLGGACGCTATQALGYVGPITATELKDNPHAGYQPTSEVGQSGLEESYEKYLRGVDGTDQLSVNAENQVVGTLHKTAPKEGDTLVTNLDANLQTVVQNALANDISADHSTLDKTTGVYPAATDGAAMVMDVNTGAVLAMASYPTYNINDWVGGISTAEYQSLFAGCSTNTSGCPLDNYAVQGLYTPGSTFKLVTATAALNDGLITPNTYFDDTGSYTANGCTNKAAAAGCTFKDDEDVGAGSVNVVSALAQSDDYFFYELGDLFYDQSSRYGSEAIQNVADQYGLDQVTGVDLPGEVQGRVDSQSERDLLHKEAPGAFPDTTWYAGDNIEMAFGQGGTVVTPIELADAYATFANGGTRYQPEVGAKILNPVTDKVVKTIEPRVTGHVSISPGNYQAILQGLEDVVVNGTASTTFQQDAHFSLNQFKIAGKTGTADIATTITNGNEEPNAWFVAFGPIPNPQYVVIAVVQHGGYGAQAAAPAVMNIFNYLVANPVGAVELPSAANPPSTTPAPSNPPAGTPASTTTTTTTAPTGTSGG